MIDRERILAKLATLDSYLGELAQIAPSSFEEYERSIEKRRACERLLQISIETVIDICAILVQSLRLGLPADEDDIFEKLVRAGVISSEMARTLKRMKGFQNILVHEYGRVDDKVVFDIIVNRMGDFQVFKREALEALRKFQP